MTGAKRTDKHRCSNSGPRGVCVLVAALLASGVTFAADEPNRLPDAPPLMILAWAGPPEPETTAERYRELADAGFTHNYTGFGSAAAMAKALDVAKAAGLKLFV